MSARLHRFQRLISSEIVKMPSERSPLLQPDGEEDRRVAVDHDAAVETSAKTPDSSGIALHSKIAKLWGPPSTERSLLIKLDFTLLLYFSIIWFLFGVNRASYSTAYISGMKEDLNFQVSSLITESTPSP